MAYHDVAPRATPYRQIQCPPVNTKINNASSNHREFCARAEAAIASRNLGVLSGVITPRSVKLRTTNLRRRCTINSATMSIGSATKNRTWDSMSREKERFRLPKKCPSTVVSAASGSHAKRAKTRARRWTSSSADPEDVPAGAVDRAALLPQARSPLIPADGWVWA